MKFKEIVEELYGKDCYKIFKAKNPSSFLSAGFFIFDLAEKTEKIQLDFFLPDKKRVAGFEFPFTKEKIFNDKIETMTELSLYLKVDIDDLEMEAKKTIIKNNSKLNPTKMIAILRDNVWNLTCFDNFLGLVRIHIDAMTGETRRFSKGNLMELMGIKKD